MTKYTHKLNKNTYVAKSPIAGGVVFEVLETGEAVEMSNHQIARLLLKSAA